MSEMRVGGSDPDAEFTKLMGRHADNVYRPYIMRKKVGFKQPPNQVFRVTESGFLQFDTQNQGWINFACWVGKTLYVQSPRFIEGHNARIRPDKLTYDKVFRTFLTFCRMCGFDGKDVIGVDKLTDQFILEEQLVKAISEVGW